MFYALALLLCLAVVFITVAGSLLLCGLLLRMGKTFLYRFSARAQANLLFTLRALPWLVAALVTLGLALPAFLRFEPRSSNEILGPRLLFLAALGALLLATIGLRIVRILIVTYRTQRQWRCDSHNLHLESVDVPLYSAHGSAPLLAVTGLFRPRIFIAQEVVEKLSPGEIFAAVAHELAHVSALDNLKQLVLKATRLPRWLSPFSGSDADWLNASEIAADEGALAGGASALDLSSALVKVAKLSRNAQSPTMIAASHLLPVSEQSSLAGRVNHLRNLLQGDKPMPEVKRPRQMYLPVCSVLALALGYALSLNAVLPWMHEVLELLVR